QIKFREGFRGGVFILRWANIGAVYGKLPDAARGEFLDADSYVVFSRLGDVQRVSDIVAHFSGIEDRADAIGESGPIKDAVNWSGTDGRRLLCFIHDWG